MPQNCHSSNGFRRIGLVPAVRALEYPNFVFMLFHYAKIVVTAIAKEIAATAFQSISNTHTSNMFILKITTSILSFILLEILGRTALCLL